MERFVTQVRGAAPNATGGAIGYIESGHAVVGAFRAGLHLPSFIAITILAGAAAAQLRRHALLVALSIPLLLAGLLTVAGSVLFNVPFNFANVIALPLILGVGVDYGVYLAQRGRVAASTQVNLLQTGTARAVLFGALITTANFGDLMLAKHPGIVSMGILLTVGLSMTLICALVLLLSLLGAEIWEAEGLMSCFGALTLGCKCACARAISAAGLKVRFRPEGGLLSLVNSHKKVTKEGHFPDVCAQSIAKGLVGPLRFSLAAGFTSTGHPWPVGEIFGIPSSPRVCARACFRPAAGDARRSQTGGTSEVRQQQTQKQSQKRRVTLLWVSPLPLRERVRGRGRSRSARLRPGFPLSRE